MKYVTSLILCFLIIKVSGQCLNVSSSKANISHRPLDTTEILQYEKMASSLQYANPLKALQVVDTGLILSIKMKWDRGRVLCLIMKGNIYRNISEPQKAAELYTAALSLCRQNGDEFNESRALGSLGNIYLTSNYYKSLSYYYQALILFRKYKNEAAIATCNRNIGKLLVQAADYENAIEPFKECIQLSLKNNDFRQAIPCYDGLASIAKAQGDTNMARRYFEHAFSLSASDTNLKDLRAGDMLNLGVLYTENKEYEKALKNLNAAYATFKNLRHKEGEATVLSNIGSIYRGRKQYNEALKYFEDQLAATDTNNKMLLAKAYMNIGVTYQDMKEYSDAITFYEKALKITGKSSLLELHGQLNALLYESQLALAERVKQIQYYCLLVLLLNVLYFIAIKKQLFSRLVYKITSSILLLAIFELLELTFEPHLSRVSGNNFWLHVVLICAASAIISLIHDKIEKKFHKTASEGQDFNKAI